jgi:hypothetical protein
MSNPPITPPEGYKPPQVVEGLCPAPCGATLTIDYPAVRAHHDAVYDSVIIPHTKGLRCGKCGMYYSIVITCLQLYLGLIQSEVPAEDKNIVQAGSMLHRFKGLKPV